MKLKRVDGQFVIEADVDWEEGALWKLVGLPVEVGFKGEMAVAGSGAPMVGHAPIQ